MIFPPHFGVNIAARTAFGLVSGGLVWAIGAAAASFEIIVLLLDRRSARMS